MAADTDLSGNDPKLVRFKVLFTKTGFEHAFPEEQELVHADMDGSRFTAWKIAEFLQNLREKGYKVPKAWKDALPTGCVTDRNILVRLPEQDRAYLRLFYEVLDRFPREALRDDEEQPRVLRDIRDRLPDAPDDRRTS